MFLLISDTFLLVGDIAEHLGVKAQYVLVCTDVTWSWEKIVRACKLRWSIEVFFRTAKQIYGLQDFHTRPFEKTSCHVTFSFPSYLLCARLRICNSKLRELTLGEIVGGYLNCLVILKRRGTCLTVYLDPGSSRGLDSPPTLPSHPLLLEPAVPGQIEI